MAIHFYVVHKLCTDQNTLIIKDKSAILPLLIFVVGTGRLNALRQIQRYMIDLQNYTDNGCFSEARSTSYGLITNIGVAH